MAKKKETVEILGYVVTEDGKKYEAVSETGKYWICRNTQFRKSNQNITFKPRKENE